MERVTIHDIAQELGVSTATVSNVIHGKTQKISAPTVKKVQELLEKRQYVPNMAAILLAQNNSRIVCAVLSDHEKYEGHMIQDPFVSSMLDGLSEQLQKHGYFMMIQKAKKIDDIVKYASMWNMAGLVLIGYCTQEYDDLRRRIRIPFVVIDGAFDRLDRFSDVSCDNFDGGYQMGNYLAGMGHRSVMFLTDNGVHTDRSRYLGMKKALYEHNILSRQEDIKLLPVRRDERLSFYSNLLKSLSSYTAAFCASDVYAIEWINFLTDNGFCIPQDFSVAGFDDIPASALLRPGLTTVNQNIAEKARQAVGLLNAMIEKEETQKQIVSKPRLVIRQSVADIRQPGE